MKSPAAFGFLARAMGAQLYSPTQDATIRFEALIGGKAMSDRDSNSFVWFLAGLGPRSGSETREVLRARAEEGRDYVRNRARDVRDQASQWADRGRDVVTQQKDQFRAAYEAGRQAYHEATVDTGGAKNL